MKTAPAPSYPSEIRALPEGERADALRAYLADSAHRQDSLDLRIQAGVALTEPEQDALVALLGKRCHARTKRTLAFVAACVPDIESRSMYGRVLLHDDGILASYCAGQCYTSEIARVRKALLK